MNLKQGVISKSSAEKSLIRILNESSMDISTKNQINPVVKALHFYTGTIEGLELFDKIFNHLRSCKQRLGVLKALFISQYAINLVGQPFIKLLLNEFFQNVLPPAKAATKDEHLLGILAANYYNILLTYANYSSDIQTYTTIGAEEIRDSILQGDHTHTTKLIAFKNIVKYFTKIKDSFEGVLVNLKKPVLVEKIMSLLLLDLSQIYNIITRVLKITMEHIFEIKGTMAFLLDELYSDTFQITKKMQNCMDKLTANGNEQPFHFEFFVLDAEFNQKEELHIQSLKKSNSKTEASEESDLEFEERRNYQTFRVGKREYKIDSDNWSVGRSHFPEPKLMKSNTSSNLSLRSNLLTSLISPRGGTKKTEYQKSFTSPQFDLKSPMHDQEIMSARETTSSFAKKFEYYHGSMSLRPDEFEMEKSNAEFNNSHRILTLNEIHSAGVYSQRSSVLNLATPKKSSFTSFFRRKQKNASILPSYGGSLTNREN